MQGKNTLIVALVFFAAVVGYQVYQQVQKYEALQSMTRDAIAECKENLEFLNKCEGFVRESGNEIAAMIQAQGDVKHELRGAAIYGLLKAGIGGEKKEAVTRISDELDKYNTEIVYAFYLTTGANLQQAYNPPTTAEMIKELSTLEQMLEK